MDTSPEYELAELVATRIVLDLDYATDMKLSIRWQGEEYEVKDRDALGQWARRQSELDAIARCWAMHHDRKPPACGII